MRYSTALQLIALPSALLHASVPCHGHQVPLTPHRHPGQHTPSLTLDEAPERIAIIGAGAGGSSAAFWVAKARERYGIDIEVDLYERNGYVGGREYLLSHWAGGDTHRSHTTDQHFLTGSMVVHPYDNMQLRPVELGASIFVEVNRNMWRAVDEFDLERTAYKDASTVMGVWDGSQFVLTVC